jgi:hypothetical protein
MLMELLHLASERMSSQKYKPEQERSHHLAVLLQARTNFPWRGTRLATALLHKGIAVEQQQQQILPKSLPSA